MWWNSYLQPFSIRQMLRFTSPCMFVIFCNSLSQCLRLFSDPISRECPTAAMTHWVYTVKSFSHGFLLFLLGITIPFHHDNYDYEFDVYVICHSFWITHFGVLKSEFWFCNCLSPEMFLPIYFFIFEWWIEHATIAILYVKLVFSTRIVYSGVPGLQLIVLVMIGAVY